MRIEDRQTLKAVILADYESYGMRHPFASRITFGENWALFSYMKTLRYLEYYTNKKRHFWDNIFLFWFWLKHRRNCAQMGIYVAPNSVGSGFHLQHRGFRHLNSNVKIGKNCEILPMVLIGNKKPEFHGQPISIGDNCYISAGATILGPVTIGNNVIVAAGAVVTKNVPDNCIVGGVPAKILKNL